MKRSFHLLLLLVSMGVVFLSSGCKDDETGPSEDKTVPSDIFPLTAGHRFEYSGYFTSADTETPIAGTSAFYSTSWTVSSSNFPLQNILGGLAAVIASKPNGRTSAALISDSTIVAPPSTKRFTPVFAYYDTASGDYFYLTNLGLFFRSSRIKDSANAADVRIDSLRFIKLASPKAGIGGEFTCLEENFVSYANPGALTTINLKITGKWESKQDITVNGQTFSTYYLVISRVASVGGIAVSTGVTAKLWLAQGIGPVKMFLTGDAEVPGNYRELKSKNF